MKKTLLFIVAGMLLVATWNCSGGGSSNGTSVNQDGTGVNAGDENGSDTGWGDDTHILTYADDYTTCVVEDTYDEGEITCYVDSVNGNDENDGLLAEFPVKSQSAIDSSCTVVRFKRGSVFN